MIPIVSMGDFINGVIALVVAARLCFLYNGVRRAGLWQFIGFYITFAIFWLLLATPEIFSTNAYYITLSTILGYVAFFIAMAFLVQIPFAAIDRKLLGIMASGFMLTLGLAYLIGRVLDPALDVKEIIPPYVFWAEAYNPWLRLLPGAAGSITALTFIATFSYIAFIMRQEFNAFRAAVYLAGGMVVMTVAAVVFFLVTTGGFLPSVIASSLCILGLLFMYRGITYMILAEKNFVAVKSESPRPSYLYEAFRPFASGVTVTALNLEK